MSKQAKKQRKPNPNRREVDEKELARAKTLYMEYASPKEISDITGIARTTLSYHANTYWKQERDMMKADLFAKFSETKRANFVKMSQSSIEIIQRALADLARRENPPTVAEAKRATEILESLDKITRLDDGDPTEIVGEKPMDLKDIQVIAGLNPFNEEIEDADYKEIEHNKKGGQ